MCGIAGWLGIVTGAEQHANRMVRTLHHRGPDASGIRLWSGAGLVHTRLSIIDLSPTGAQPISNEDGTVWTVFNGEIYNHRQLRHPLEVRGHSFRGRSDTEVLPHLFEEHGIEFLPQLQGMFALAIYDVPSRTLILARDRFGIKPLFYVPSSRAFLFASELRPLLEFPEVDTRPDNQAICDFAALSYIPAPETFYRGIRSLEPGHVVEARFNGECVSWKTSRYHSWMIAPDPALTLNQAAGRADELLTRAVERQLESDVPLGCLLSGGIDSSLVSLAAQNSLQGELRTFNVRFSEKTHDETWAAELVAKHIGSRHESLNMDQTPGNWDHVTRLLLHTGQPFADTSLFAVNAICRLMRQHVTVAMSGDGGDEGFGGYDIYWRLARIANWQQLPALFLNAASFALRPVSWYANSLAHIPNRMRDLAGADDTAVIQGLFSFIDESEHKNLLNDTDVLPVRRLFERRWEHHIPKPFSRIERLSAHATEVNVRLTLANDFLFKVDSASMMESLEVRVPLLDEDLFAFGLTLPQKLKVSGRTSKQVLRAVAARRLPAEIANKPKWGFAVPLTSWLGRDMKSYLRDVLLSPASKLSELFRPKAYQPIIEAFCDDGSHYPSTAQELYARVIMLVAVDLELNSSSSNLN